MPETTANDPSDAELAGSQRRRRNLIAALLVAHGVAALVSILGMGIGDRSARLLLVIPLTSIAISQGSLIGIWIAFGGRATPWRLIGVTVGLIGCMWCLEWAMPRSDARSWSYFVLAETVGVSVLLVLLRFSGVGIAWPASAAPVPQRQKFQFSIRAIMEWTVAVAVLLGTLPMTPEEFRGSFISEGPRLYGFFVSNALLTLAALWIGLGMRWRASGAFLRCSAFLFAAIGIIAAIGAMTDAYPGPCALIVLHAATVVWLVGSLWVLRRAGYRLVWRGTVRT